MIENRIEWARELMVPRGNSTWLSQLNAVGWRALGIATGGEVLLELVEPDPYPWITDGTSPDVLSFVLISAHRRLYVGQYLDDDGKRFRCRPVGIGEWRRIDLVDSDGWKYLPEPVEPAEG